MSLYEIIIRKRDFREYTDDPISGESLHRLLTAARMAVSAKNSQPVRYVVVSEQAQKEALAQCGGWTTPLPKAKCVIVLMLKKGANPLDAGRAAQNLMLAAWSEGIASCPVSVYPDEEVRKVLGHPDDFSPAISIALGYPKPGVPMSRGRKRLPLEELVHHERW